MQVLSPWQSGGAMHKAQLLMARCCPPHSCTFTASWGPQVLSTWAPFQAAPGIFTCSAIKPWKAMNLGPRSHLHSAGVGERWGAVAVFLQSWHFYAPLSQLTAGASRTVKPWPQIIVGSIPGQA